MKAVIITTIVMLACSTIAETRKAAVFLDKFIPNEGCNITAGGIQILHDRIVGNVVSSRKYEVVERENLAKVQKELKLIDAGMTEGNAPESNKLKAAGYCIYGKIIQYRSNKYAAGVVHRTDGIVELQIRITNIENGRQLAAKTIKIVEVDTTGSTLDSNRDSEREAMTRAVEKAAKEVVIKLNDVAFPVYVMSVNNKFVTANVSEEQVTEGDVWEAYAIGDELIDDQTGECDGYDEELVGNLRVSRPGPKRTKFEPVTEKDAKAILKAWEEANETATVKDGKRRPRMVLHKAPEKVAKDIQRGTSAKKDAMPDFSNW